MAPADIQYSKVLNMRGQIDGASYPSCSYAQTTVCSFEFNSKLQTVVHVYEQLG